MPPPPADLGAAAEEVDVSHQILNTLYENRFVCLFAYNFMYMQSVCHASHT
jgi:hypothetical protein